MFANQFVIDSGKICIEKCPHEDTKTKYLICGDAVLKLRYLQHQFKDVEFLVYGNSIKLADNSYKLEDVVVPEQVVGHASVDNVVVVGTYNTVLHKHPGNMTNFSSTDDEFVNSNHDFSLLIGSSDLKNANGIASIQLECNRYMKVKLDIDIVVPMSKDEEFIKSVAKNIKLSTPKQGFWSTVIYGKQEERCSKCKSILIPIPEKEDEFLCNVCNIQYHRTK